MTTLWTSFVNQIPEHQFYWRLERSIDDEVIRDTEGRNWRDRPRELFLEYVLYGVLKDRYAEWLERTSDTEIFDNWDVCIINYDLRHLIELMKQVERKWSSQKDREAKILDDLPIGGVIVHDYRDADAANAIENLRGNHTDAVAAPSVDGKDISFKDKNIAFHKGALK